MSLKYLVSILPFTHSSDEPLSPSHESSTIRTLSSSVRYIQRTLLGLKRLNPSARLVATSLDCPIDYLPVELLRKIFIFCLPDVHPLNTSDLHISYPIPRLALSQVCSHWRDVALSFPDLWSTFIIESPVQHHVNMMKLCLERSGQVPLNFYISNERCYISENECTSTAVTADVINLLWPQAHRWKSATFKLFSHYHPSADSLPPLPPGAISLLEPFLSLPLDHFSLLERVHFEVDIHFAMWHEGIEKIGEMFLSLPQLKEFGWKTRYHLLRAPSPPATLTHLSGNFTLDTMFCDLLAELKNLQFLRFNGTCKWNLHAFSPQTLFTLNHLHTLDLRRESSLTFLDLIVTPNLKVLIIDTRISEEDYPVVPLFLDRSRCSLRSFSYFSSTGEPSESRFWKDLFASPFVDSLSELNVGSRNADPVLSMLSWTNPFKPDLPLLSRFWLSTRKCTIGHLYDMIETWIDHFQPPSGPAMSEGLFDGINCPGSIRPPALGRSLFIRSSYIQANGSRNRAQLNKLIKRNACGHVTIIPTSPVKEAGNLLPHLWQGSYTGDLDE